MAKTYELSRMNLDTLLNELEQACEKGLWELLPELDERFREAVTQRVQNCPAEHYLELRDTLDSAQVRYKTLVASCMTQQQTLKEKSSQLQKQHQAAQQYINQF